MSRDNISAITFKLLFFSFFFHSPPSTSLWGFYSENMHSSRILHSFAPYIKENNHKSIKDKTKTTTITSKKPQNEQQKDRTHIHIHIIYIYNIQTWHNGTFVHDIHAHARFDELELDFDFQNVCKACPACFSCPPPPFLMPRNADPKWWQNNQTGEGGHSSRED